MAVFIVLLIVALTPACLLKSLSPISPIVATSAFAAAVILYFSYAVFLYPFYLSPLRHLPEPEGGSFPWFHADVIRKQNNGEPFRTWINSVPNNGLIRYRVLLNQERVVVTSPEGLRELLVSKAYDFVKPWRVAFLIGQLSGNGILVTEGDAHKPQRKALLPAFSYRHIKDLYPNFWAKARQVTDAIAIGARSGKSQSAYDWASRVSLDIIGLAGFGHDFDSVANPESELNRTYNEFTAQEPEIFRWELIGLKVPVELLFRLPLSALEVARRGAATIRGVAYKMIQENRKALEKSGTLGVDILSAALGSGQFADEELADQCMTFLGAGHDTTAGALTWIIYLLCKHQDVQKRLRKEVRASLPSIRDAGATVSALDIDRVAYLNAVCNEVLRVMPAVPLTSRVATDDTEILGQRIPKGTALTAPAWAVNVSHELWGPDALEFNPDRWMGEGRANSGGVSNNYAFLTFIHGPRSCIGKDFAKAELMCLVAAWIGRFEARLADPDMVADARSMKGSITVKPVDRLPVIFKEVNGW